MTEYRVGQVVELNDGRTAEVQFVGPTSFAEGEWVGVLLDDATGKNDGSVKGVRYFECDPNHGMFLRPTAIGQVLQQPAPKLSRQKTALPNGKPTAPSAGAVSKSRPSSIIGNGVKRPSQDMAASKRQSINAASPSPAPRPAVNGRKVSVQIHIP